jgi:glycosyltransferase involved in cell wall biosynthesis
MLIRAFRDISSNFPDIKLQIIGKGELKNFYKKICKELGLLEKIEIIDQANHAEVAAYMKNADIYVQTSNSETFGMTIVEAMACGLPVIATRTQGPSSYIDNGKNGLLIDKNNVKDLVDKLKNLINNPQLRKEIGSKAAEDAASHFGDYAKLIALYREIANNE